MMRTPLWGKHTNAEGHEGESGRIMLHQPLKEEFLFLKEDFIFSKKPLSLNPNFVREHSYYVCFLVS